MRRNGRTVTIYTSSYYVVRSSSIGTAIEELDHGLWLSYPSGPNPP